MRVVERITPILALCVASAACKPDLACGDLVEDRARRVCTCPNGGEYRDGLCYLDGSVTLLDGSAVDPDGSVEEGDAGLARDACALRIFYRDADGDGHGDRTRSMEACEAPDGYVESDRDCDDACDTCRPGGTEVCDVESRDEDCDGVANAGCECTSASLPRVCGTSDEGACQRGEQRCVGGRYGECEGAVGPRDETCNGVDDDCDGSIDEAGGTTVYFRDRDGDGFGSSSEAMTFCTPPAGWVAQGGDCVDSNPLVFPGQTSYFRTPIDGVSASRRYDYDCDGFNTPQVARVVSTPSACVMIEPSATYRRCWIGSAPGCGEFGDLFECANATPTMNCPAVRSTRSTCR